MSKQTLAVKYRPKRFSEVVEQDITKSILLSQLKDKSFKNCMLFVGSAGTGKTTSARIFANEINNFKGNPIEIDAASHNSVEDIRKIINDAKYQSLDSDYKVYILDEVHALSNQSWQALLKIIEEPPKKTVFIMCTTEVQKIPATILSRVPKYTFQKISHNGIVSRLEYIIESENTENKDNSEFQTITYEDEALKYIAKLADGGMRDSVTLLDKAIGFTNNLTLNNVLSALGSVNYDDMFILTDALLNMDKKVVIETVETIHRKGLDLKQFIKQYNSFILDVCKYNILNSFDYLQIPSIYEDKLSGYSADDYNFFEQLLSELISLNNNIKWETTPKPIIESTFLVLCMEE